jgi:hypothetical protein
MAVCWGEALCSVHGATTQQSFNCTAVENTGLKGGFYSMDVKIERASGYLFTLCM